jgi:hypothetical protein
MKIAISNMQSGSEGVHTPLKYVSVLTPPALVCAAFLVALVAFLRHEMGARRQRSEDLPGEDIADEDLIPGPKPDTTSEDDRATERLDDE